MNRRLSRIRRAVLLLALLTPPCFATTAYLQPDAIFEGDITELVIEYDSKIPSLYALETAPLLAEFEILDIKSRVSRLELGTAYRHRMQWRLQLLPRGSGRLQVPPLSFGDQTTRPLSLEVKPVPDDMQSSQEIFIEFDSQPHSPYVGQQTRLSLRLYHNAPLRIDGLAEPRLGEVGSYRDLEERIDFVDRDGREFRVLERQILFFPDADGALELPPAVLRGQLRQQSAAGDGEAKSRKISRSSNPLHLQVRAPPATFGGRYWLPARNLVLSQRLQQRDGELRIGDSFDWILTLEATGLPAASLPDNLLAIEAENFTVYADRARRSDRLDAGNLVGRLEQRFAVIVTAAGEIELPPISLAWWDLNTDSERHARLEANRIGIALGDDRQTSGAADPGIYLPAANATGNAFWPLLGLALIAVLTWGARMLGPALACLLDPPLRRWRVRALLKQACLQNHAARARALLIEWGRARWPGETVHGLHRIRERVGPGALADQLARLDAALFAPGEGDWCGSDLWTAIRTERRNAAGGRRRDQLPGLYPP